ncbi:MAG: Mfa1 fimbrilin C-terminal domain-containing protein [Paramuribaculum sp.]|nr:Mfa1 fimbrilin C-terminal domain-containing protein [Paramuribaculum sp.]
MSNSVYYGADGKLIMGVAIPVDAIFEKEDDAKAALESATGEDIIDIYVERYAAKLRVTGIDDATVTPYETAGLKYTVGENGAITRTEVPIVLTFNVTGWAVNGESKSTYLIKSFRESAKDGQILTENIPYATINARINSTTIGYNPETGVITTGGNLSTWVWNSPANHRSYWALSPVYFQSEYPEVLTDYKGHENEYSQVFLSYNQITGEGGTTKLGFAGNDTEFHYFKETTSGYPALRSKNPNAAVASVAIVGRYSLKVDGADVPANTSFYTYLNNNPNGVGKGNASVYFEVAPTGATTGLESAVAGGTSMKERFLRQVTVLYQNTAAEGETPNYVRYSDLSALAGVTEIATPTEEVLTTTETTEDGTTTLVAKFASRSRTLQIKKEVSLTGIYINNQGTPMKIVPDDETPGDNEVTLTDANRILWQNVGTCNFYQLGSAFYDVPVKHLGWYRADNPQRNSTQIDFSLVRLGDLGMVRNHSYTINIDGITGLAAGIGGVDDAIIPPADTKDVYMAYRVNILKWAVVPEQGVTLE